MSTEARAEMILHVYVCNRCRGDLESRTFERVYNNYREAEQAPMPTCPRCKRNDYVTRFFGHSIFAPPRSHSNLPLRFVPYASRHRKGIVSVGFTVSGENAGRVEEDLHNLAERNGIEVVQGEGLDAIVNKLGLKENSLDHKLFEAKQKKLINELSRGVPFSGFFMPLSGDPSN
ncbi:MAG: hypothetical protein AB1742_13805 [bacterium]